MAHHHVNAGGHVGDPTPIPKKKNVFLRIILLYCGSFNTLPCFSFLAFFVYVRVTNSSASIVVQLSYARAYTVLLLGVCGV